MHHKRDTCNNDNSFNGEYMTYRIVSIFVVLAASAIGSFSPLLAKSNKYFQIPNYVLFFLKYLGSGVIVATGFIHLLAEANEALSDPCLGGVWENYPWTEGICLAGVFVMFFFDIVAHKKLHDNFRKKLANDEICPIKNAAKDATILYAEEEALAVDHGSSSKSDHSTFDSPESLKSLYQKILNCLILEFGIVFHSVFVGLSLAIAGDEFIVLFIAITFHQLLEGLGLGARFATTTWPSDKPWIPWVLSLCYSLTTPIAIAIGLGIRKSYPPGSRAALVTTGVFDALCGGIIIYNSLVELMAHDFLFSSSFDEDPNMNRMLLAFTFLTVGAALMALIGYWA